MTATLPDPGVLETVDAPAPGGGVRVNLVRYARSVVRRPGLLIAWLMLVLVALVALGPSLFTSTDPLQGIGNPSLEPPGAAFWFGTDSQGRDVYGRVIHGAGDSVKAVLVAVAVGAGVGALLGLIAGYLGRWVDDVVMRVMDVLLAIPTILVALMFVAALGQGLINVAIAVGLANVAGFARVMRAQVLKVRNMSYVEGTVFSGLSQVRVLFTHVLPNSMSPMFVLATLELGSAMLSVATLSFLGFGAAPPAPEWGAMVSLGRDYIAAAWWLVVFPGLAIAVTVLAANRIARSFTDGADAL